MFEFIRSLLSNVGENKKKAYLHQYIKSGSMIHLASALTPYLNISDDLVLSYDTRILYHANKDLLHGLNVYEATMRSCMFDIALKFKNNRDAFLAPALCSRAVSLLEIFRDWLDNGLVSKHHFAGVHEMFMQISFITSVQGHYLDIVLDWLESNVDYDGINYIETSDKLSQVKKSMLSISSSNQLNEQKNDERFCITVIKVLAMQIAIAARNIEVVHKVDEIYTLGFWIFAVTEYFEPYCDLTLARSTILYDLLDEDVISKGAIGAIHGTYEKAKVSNKAVYYIQHNLTNWFNHPNQENFSKLVAVYRSMSKNLV